MLRNYFSHPLKLNARGNLLDACPKVECSGQPTSAGTIAVSVCKPVPAKYTLRYIKGEEITQFHQRNQMISENAWNALMRIGGSIQVISLLGGI